MALVLLKAEDSGMEVVEDRSSKEHLDWVLRALTNPEWDFRTVESLAQETKLSPSEVQSILDQHPELFRKSPVTSKEGKLLYTLQERPIRWKERLALLHRSLRWS